MWDEGVKDGPWDTNTSQIVPLHWKVEVDHGHGLPLPWKEELGDRRWPMPLPIYSHFIESMAI